MQNEDDQCFKWSVTRASNFKEIPTVKELDNLLKRVVRKDIQNSIKPNYLSKIRIVLIKNCKNRRNIVILNDTKNIFQARLATTSNVSTKLVIKGNWCLTQRRTKTMMLHRYFWKTRKRPTMNMEQEEVQRSY